MTFGYTGKVLKVDLSTLRVEVEEPQTSFYLESIGGGGLNSIRLLRETEPDMDPFAEEAPVYFGVGPLTGTGLSASSRFTVTAKSPLTGIFGDTNAGGHWASELKFAGYDQIVITGKSDTPVFLFLDGSTVKLLDAQAVWGRGIRETTRLLLSQTGLPDAQVLAIGPAGENLVKYACVAANLTRIGGRTGMGAVLGAKKLKAIVVRGKSAVTVADPGEFDRVVKEIDHRIEAHPGFARRKALGTTALMTDLNRLGILPTRHFQQGMFEAIDRVSGEHLAEHFKVKNKACFNCNVHCSRYYAKGGVRGEGPEFETLCSFTSKLGLDDAAFALAMNNRVNDAGLDSISTGETIAWAMECAQRGLLTASDAGGLDLSWGNRETVDTLVDQIIRREGFGRLLAEGVRNAAKQIGRGTERYAFHVKGLEMICGDPRGLKAYGLTYAIATRGADHLHAEPFFELTGDYEEARKRFGTEKAADRLAWEGKARLVHWSERMALLTDCLTMCKNIGLCMDILDFPLAVELLCAGTGMAWSEQILLEALDRILLAERAFNRREGIVPADDILPQRFLHEPLQEGPSAGSVVELDNMLDEYQQL